MISAHQITNQHSGWMELLFSIFVVSTMSETPQVNALLNKMDRFMWLYILLNQEVLFCNAP